MPNENELQTSAQQWDAPQEGVTPTPEGTPQQAAPTWGAKTAQAPQATETSASTESTFNGSPAPHKSRKGLVATLVSVGAVILLVVAGLLGYFLWYQNSDKVIGDALSNAFSADSVAFNATLDTKDKKDGEVTKLTVDGKGDKEATQIDIALDAGSKGRTVKIDGSVIVSGEDFYGKLNNLEDLATSLLGGSAAQITASPFGAIIKKVDGNWIKVSSGDLKDLSDDADKTQACVTDLVKKAQDDKSYTKEIVAAYKDNLFIVVDKKLGSKKIADVASLGYEVSIDIPTLKAFIIAVGETKLGTELAKCDDSIDFKEIADDTKEPKDGKVPTIEIWVSRFGHQLTGVTVVPNEEENVEGDLTATFNFNEEVKIEVPAKAITIDELKKDIEAIVKQMQPPIGPVGVPAYGSSYSSPYSTSSRY